MTRRNGMDGLTGLEALAEIGRRLGQLPEQMKTAMKDGAAGAEGERAFTIDTPAGPLTGVASMRVRTGSLPSGGAKRQPFRAERPARAYSPDVAGAREPLVDSFDEGDEIVVTAELPGVRTDEIDLTIDGEDLVIRTTGQRRYLARQPLGGPVLAGSLSPELRNGILSVRIRKTPA